MTYYIAATSRGGTSDWQRARPVSLFDAQQAPYDASYYLKKLDDWIDRYGTWLGITKQEDQAELAFD